MEQLSMLKLFHICLQTLLEVVSVFLSKIIQSSKNSTHFPVTTRIERVLDFLFENGADINGKYYSDGETLLHYAIRHTDPSPFNMKYFYKGVFEHLISRGADVNAQNDQGFAPLHLAVNRGIIDIN